MRIPSDDAKSRDSRYFLAAEDVGKLVDDAVPLLDRAVGVDWYEHGGNDADRAAQTAKSQGGAVGVVAPVLVPVDADGPIKQRYGIVDELSDVLGG